MEPSKFVSVFTPNDREKLRAELVRLCDEEKCPLVLTLGHTGPGAQLILHAGRHDGNRGP